MKLSFQQLYQQITKKLAPIYIISGDEPLLAQEAVDLLRDAAVKAGFSERIRLAADADWGKALYDNTQTLSLFSSQRLIEIDLTTTKFNATTSKILQEYAAHPPSDTLLIIRITKLDAKTEQSNWYKTLDKHCIIVPLWPIVIEQLPAWILQRAKKLALNMTASAAARLATLVEGNLLAATQELEKLRLLNLDSIDPQTIEETVVDHAHFDIFMLVDSALLGDSKRSLRVLDNLKAEDAEPMLILWALVRELRTLATLAKQISTGTPLTALFSKFRIWDKRQPAVRAFLQRHKQPQCWNFIAHAAQIDRIIKGAEMGNGWDELKKLVLKINLAANRHALLDSFF